MGPISDGLSNIDFGSFVSALHQGGWYEIVFPFMLVYAIVFTILEKVDLFKEKKSIRVILSLIIGLFSVAFPINGNFSSCDIGRYSTGCETLGSLMMTLFPGVTAFSMMILGLYIVVAMLGVDLTKFFGENDENNKFIFWILGGLGALVVLYYYARGFGWGGFSEGGFLVDLFTDPFLYILAVFGLMFYYISSDDGNSGSSSNNKK